MKTYTHKHLGATDGAICSHEKCKQIYRRTSNHNCTVNFMQLCTTIIILASLVAQTVKRLPAVQETRVWSLGQDGKIPWRRKQQPTPVLLPGKSHGWRSLVVYSLWGRRVGHDWATSLSFFLFFIGIQVDFSTMYSIKFEFFTSTQSDTGMLR